MERLGQVIIGPRFQAMHAVFHRIPRREHQNGRRIALRPQSLTDSQAIHPRQHQIQHNEFVPVFRRLLVSLRPVMGNVYGEAVFFQPRRDHLSNRVIIFYE